MKNIFTLSFLLTIFGFSALIPCSAQNALPVISNLIASVDTVAHEVTLSYDIADAEGDDLEVWIQISSDGGRTWLIPNDSITGDIGFPVIPSTSLQAVWTYDPAQLSSLIGTSGLTGFRARVIADDRVVINVADLVAMVDSARIMQNLQFIEGIRHRTGGLTHLMDVRDSLKTLIADRNLQDWHDPYVYAGYNAENLIGRRSGIVAETKTWLISGHYDTVNIAPGADDNGSAVVGVMEALNVLGDLQFEKSVRYIFFDLEESTLNGSARYVSSFIPDWEETEGLLNMETMGYYSDQPNSQNIPFGFEFLFPAATDSVNADSGRGNFLTNVANTPSTFLQEIFDSCAHAYVPELRVIDLTTPGTGIATPDLLRSDHAPFWTSGIPALMLTDGADFRNPNYHTPGDTLGTINSQFLYRNIKAVISTLATVAKPRHAGVGESNDFILSLPLENVPVEWVTELSVAPNPGEDHFNITFNLNQPEKTKVLIYNLEGKLVREIADKKFAAGNVSVEWNGADVSGRPVSKGMYFVKVISEHGEGTCRVLVGDFSHHH